MQRYTLFLGSYARQQKVNTRRENDKNNKTKEKEEQEQEQERRKEESNDGCNVDLLGS